MVHFVVFPLMVVGALNWGLVALFNYNLVESLLGTWPEVVKWTYVLIGASAVLSLATHQTDCKTCGEMMKK